MQTQRYCSKGLRKLHAGRTSGKMRGKEVGDQAHTAHGKRAAHPASFLKLAQATFRPRRLGSNGRQMVAS